VIKEIVGRNQPDNFLVLDENLNKSRFTNDHRLVKEGITLALMIGYISL